MQLAVDHPDRVKAAMAPISRMMLELVDAANAAGAINVADTRRAAALMQQTVMYSWFGNRLVENPRMRLTAEETWEFCLHGLERLSRDRRSDAVEVEHADRVAAQHLVALLVGERRGHRARPPRARTATSCRCAGSRSRSRCCPRRPAAIDAMPCTSLVKQPKIRPR